MYRYPPVGGEQHDDSLQLGQRQLKPTGKSAKQLGGGRELQTKQKYSGISRDIMGRAQQVEEAEKKREGQVATACSCSV